MFGKSLAGNKYSRNFLHQAALRKTSPFSACPSARALPPRKTAIKNTPQLLARYLFGDPCGNLPRPKNSPRGCFCPAGRWTRGCDLRLPHQAAPLGRGLPSATAAPAPASCFRRRRRSPPQQAVRFPHGSPFTPDTY